MSSRQSANAASSSGFQYASVSPGLTQLDILLSPEQGNPVNAGASSGTGSNAVARQLLPILPVSVAVATPSGVFGSTGAAVGTSGLTSNATTATCTLGNPHGYAIGATSVTVTIVNTGNTAYNVTNAAATITGPYTFTYTTTGSGLAASGGGTASLQVPAWSATQSAGVGNTAAVLPAGTTIGSTGQPFSSAIVGSTIRGQVVGTLEFWGDGTYWDTSNNRPLGPGVDFDVTVQWKNS